MEGMFSMSQILYNQVDQIADVKMCKINDVETKCYKVLWKCTWEPEMILQTFCGDMVEEYKKSGHTGPNICSSETEPEYNKENLPSPHNEYKEKHFVATHIGEKIIEKFGISDAESVIDKIDAICSSNNRHDDALEENNENLNFVLNLEKDSHIKQRKLISSSENILDNNTLQANQYPDINTIRSNIKKEFISETFHQKINISNTSEPRQKTLDKLMEMDHKINNINYSTKQDKYNIVSEEAIGSASMVNVSQPNTVNLSKDIINVDVNLSDGNGMKSPISRDLNDNILEDGKHEISSYTVTQKHQPSSLKSYVCHICLYSTKIKCNLKSHMRKHTGEKPYKCNSCPYSAAHMVTLQNHLAKHTGKKSLQRSQRSSAKYTKDRPFKCNLCCYATTKNYLLTYHILIHKDTNDSGITHMVTLQNHLAKHTGKKSLQRSQRYSAKYTKDRPFKCNLCSYATTKNYLLTYHMLIHKDTNDKHVDTNNK